MLAQKSRAITCAIASAAVWLHAVAADVAAGEIGERGLLVRDVIARLAQVSRDCESPS